MTFSQRAPRALLTAVAALSVASALATLAAPASGQTPAPSPSGSAPPAGPEIELLNPSTAYDRGPKVSDRFDGTDDAYPIVARVAGSPAPALVEAEVTPQLDDGGYGNPLTVGELARVNDASGVWQLAWEIPATVPEGPARFTVRSYVETPEGFVEAASDRVDVDIAHTGPDAWPLGAYESVEMTWPEQHGVLGWYRPRVGAYRVIVEGTTSPGASFVQMLVSTSPPGEPLAFTPCGSSPATQRPDGTRTFAGRCTLSATTFPSQVRAIAAVAELRDEASGIRFPHAADVSVVTPYLVSPDDMTIAISPSVRRAAAPATACQSLTATVRDDHGRLVLGANVDVHATGPSEQLLVTDLGLVAPAGHALEEITLCPGAPPVPTDPRYQGEHNVPGAIDPKHVETTLGTGLDYLAQPAGRTTFRIASGVPGFTEIQAWVDDEEIRRETEQRPPDDDRLGPEEPVATARLQWLATPVALSLDPVGGTEALGTCFPYTVKARSGTAAVPGINVDLHATGPSDALDFCDPAGAPARRAPSSGTGGSVHEGEDSSESHHFGSTGPDAQHTEGKTDAAGNFVVGLTSPDAGDTSVVAWVDGEAGADDDVQGGGEVASSGTISWVSSPADADLSFVNPSPFGGGTAGPGTGTQLPDRGGVVPVLVRVDMAGHAPGVEVLLSTDGRRTYSYLGEATRVRSTDLFELQWPVDVPDGTYGLRARIEGTGIVEDIDVKVGAGEVAPMTPAPSYETLVLSEPVAGEAVAFSRRAAVVAGRASAGAEGVDVFYTKVPAKDTPRPADWIFCGYADLSGTGTAPQDFDTLCTLRGSDQPAQVTGIAAITFDCTVDGCDANPTPPTPDPTVPALREQGQKDTGRALRVFGYDAQPLLVLEPPETEAVAGACRRFDVVLRDQTGQPIGRENVDLHLAGGHEAHFCRPPDGGPGPRAPDAGGHTGHPPEAPAEGHHGEPAGSRVAHAEGETLPDGSLSFGLTAAGAGDTQVTAWLDRADDDVKGAGEVADTSVLHWVEPDGCSVSGSDGPDVLVGTPGDDVLCGFEGHDVLRGRGGSDRFLGGDGSDRIVGGDRADTLLGGRGADRLDGGGGRDSCRGGPGRDRLRRCEDGAAAAAERRSGV